LTPAALAIALALLAGPKPNQQTILDLQTRLATDEKTIAELRQALDQARSQTAARIETVRQGLEIQTRGLDSRLQQAQTEAAAARAIAAGKEQLIERLTEQLNQTEARSTAESRTAAVIVQRAQQAATSARQVEARSIDTSRNIATVAETAASHAQHAAELGEENHEALDKARAELKKQSEIIAALNQGETKSRRLNVLLAAIGAVIVAFSVSFRRRRP
jgi:chromosome segregation ATPase